MKTRVVFTVDTEPSIAGHYEDPERYLPVIHEPVSGDVDGRSEALGFLLRTLGKHDLCATFFVETLHTSYFRNGEMGAYAARLAEAGQDVQLHLHPTWLNFRNGVGAGIDRISDHCYDLAHDELVEVISDGCDAIEKWTGRRPTSMRTGNFSTDRGVFAAARECGLKTASNLNLSAHVPSEKELRIDSGIALIEGVWELPVTNFTDIGPVGRGRPRPMQITSLSYAEQVRMLNRIRSRGGSVAVIITHPFEFTKCRDPQYRGLRPNRMVQRRFERLCTYLDRNRDRFEVVTMGALGETEMSEEPAFGLRGHAGLAFFRAANNFINDRI